MARGVTCMTTAVLQRAADRLTCQVVYFEVQCQPLRGDHRREWVSEAEVTLSHVVGDEKLVLEWKARSRMLERNTHHQRGGRGAGGEEDLCCSGT